MSSTATPNPFAFPERPWERLTDAEFAALRTFIQAPLIQGTMIQGTQARPRPGRPHENLRRTLDAIFWIATSREPWRMLPPDLGKADSAHRMLRRWAKAGVLDRMMEALAAPAESDHARLLHGMGWWLCRAWRRTARVAPVTSLELIRRLNLVSAWPAETITLPAPPSENARQAYAVALGAEDLARELREAGLGGKYTSGIVASGWAWARASHAIIRAAHQGNRAEWRVK
jgi:transposase